MNLDNEWLNWWFVGSLNKENINLFYFRNMKKILFCVLLLHCVGIFIPGYKNDLQCWSDWSKILQNNWSSSEINYPPLFLNYLWLIGKFPDEFLSLYRNSFGLIPIKLISLLPVLFAQMWLVYRVYFRYGALVSNWIAFNPIFWLCGPVWGQVDLVLAVLAIESIWALEKKSYIKMSIFLALSFSFKMQIIMLVPFLIMVLFKQKFKWKQAMLSLSVFALIWFLCGIIPFVNESLFSISYAAYVGNVHLFPYMTLNAPNFWMIFLDNLTSANELCWGIRYQYVGYFMMLIAYVFYFYLFQKLYKPERLLLWAGMSVLIFFYFAPNMHERYFVLAIPFVVIFLLNNRRNMELVGWYIYGSLSLSVPLVLSKIPWIIYVEKPLALLMAYLLCRHLKQEIEFHRNPT